MVKPGKTCMEVIETLSNEIVRSLNKRDVRTAYQQARFGERLYGYQDVVMRACAEAFRWYGGQVYRHDGRVWCPVEDIVLESAVNKAMVKCGVPPGDMVNGRAKILYSAKGGATMSPLKLSANIVGFSNGVWDFSDIDHPVYHTFSDRMPVTSLLPYEYDEHAVCPRWQSFLQSVLPKGDIMKLQKFFGLGCVDRRTMSHKIEETLWLIGGGANGKSTIFDVVRAVYGHDNISYVALDSLLCGSSDVRARFIGSIVGKVFNYCSEIQSDDISRFSDTFKSLCSGEPQTVRRLGCNPETATDIPFLVFNMNRRPSDRNMDRALVRRLLFVPFRTSVTASDMNRELSSELMSELPGIRNWMIEGYRRLVSDGYRFDLTNDTEEMEDYMLENGQSVQVFLSRRGYRCDRRSGHWEDKPQWVQAQALYEEYVSFCEKELQEPVSQRRFGSEMSRLGWHWNGGNRKRSSIGYIYGIFTDKNVTNALTL